MRAYPKTTRQQHLARCRGGAAALATRRAAARTLPQMLQARRAPAAGTAQRTLARAPRRPRPRTVRTYFRDALAHAMQHNPLPLPRRINVRAAVAVAHQPRVARVAARVKVRAARRPFVRARRRVDHRGAALLAAHEAVRLGLGAPLLVPHRRPRAARGHAPRSNHGRRQSRCARRCAARRRRHIHSRRRRRRHRRSRSRSRSRTLLRQVQPEGVHGRRGRKARPQG
jgi:hypothetical protein